MRAVTQPVVVLSTLAALGFTAACSAILGITDFSAGAGDAGPDGTTPGDGAPMSDSMHEDGATDDGPLTGPCTPDAAQCTGNALQLCSASGQWGPAMDCDGQACVSGGCSGVCAPGSTQCSGHTPQTCTGDGGWQSGADCPEGCSAGACVHFNSCMGGAPGAGNDCGPGSSADGGTSDCCSSLAIPGSMFFRSYDAVSTGDTMQTHPATVSSLRMDAYEITVGRFRSFVSAVVGGWLPAAGSGKHTYLNGGNGLANASVAGTFEGGWDATWTPNLATTQTTWDSNLGCDTTYGTWTPAAGGNEHRPINCLTWYEAYAFCIWDGGFLPSEAEWNFAASGGSQQRVYPWSTPATSQTIDCSYANYAPSPASPCVATGANDVGSESPKGDGRWGHSDLAGNLAEWNLDVFASYVTPCSDCANLPSSTVRIIRGGDFQLIGGALIASYRSNNDAAMRDPSFGARCARAP